MSSEGKMQLTWTSPSKPDEKCRYDHIRSETPFGGYLISWKSWKDYPSYSIEFRDEFVAANDGLEDAKQSAQADFDRRLEECGSRGHGQ
jgi:hypothetical protein